jgi:hypothetical protein
MISRTAALVLLLGASASADSADSISSRLQVHVRIFVLTGLARFYQRDNENGDCKCDSFAAASAAAVDDGSSISYSKLYRCVFILRS